MTDQPTNPLVAAKARIAGKATVEYLLAETEKLNASAAENNCPWRFAVVPNDKGKMCVRKVDHRPAPRLLAKRDVMDCRGEAMSAADTAELNQRLEYRGATARYREDGSRYHIERKAA